VFSSRVFWAHGASTLTASSFKTLTQLIEDIPVENYVPAAERFQDDSEFNPIIEEIWDSEIVDSYRPGEWNNTGTTGNSNYPYITPRHPHPAMYSYTQQMNATNYSSALLNPSLRAITYQNTHRYGTFNSPADSSGRPDRPRPDNGWSTLRKVVVSLMILALIMYGGYRGVKYLVGLVIQSIRGTRVGAGILDWIFGVKG
jgi:hypothetical protein